MVAILSVFLQWTRYRPLARVVSVVIGLDLLVRGRWIGLSLTAFGWWAARLWGQAARDAQRMQEWEKRRRITGIDS